jgi:uncharacterized protein (TIGR00730 family)
MKPDKEKIHPSARQGAIDAERVVKCPQSESDSYRLAYTDTEFMLRDELRPVRLQLELLKAELGQQEAGVECTVVMFGSTHIPDPLKASDLFGDASNELASDPENEELLAELRRTERLVEKSRYYAAAQELAGLVAEKSEAEIGMPLVVTTGGGPGIMEAANRGASEAGARTVGLNIVLPFEQEPNAYITEDLSFQFHYFAIRKLHFLLRARALVVFPGGFGTLDELFETLTLIQTRKIKPIPVLLFGREYWEKLIDFQYLVDEGTIHPENLDIFQYVETADEAFGRIVEWYSD